MFIRNAVLFLSSTPRVAKHHWCCMKAAPNATGIDLSRVELGYLGYLPVLSVFTQYFDMDSTTASRVITSIYCILDGSHE